MIATTRIPPNMTLFVDNLHQVLGAASEKIYSEATASQAPVVYPFQFGPTINYQTDLDAPETQWARCRWDSDPRTKPDGQFCDGSVFRRICNPSNISSTCPPSNYSPIITGSAQISCRTNNVVWIKGGSGPLLSPARARVPDIPATRRNSPSPLRRTGGAREIVHRNATSPFGQKFRVIVVPRDGFLDVTIGSDENNRVSRANLEHVSYQIVDTADDDHISSGFCPRAPPPWLLGRTTVLTPPFRAR